MRRTILSLLATVLAISLTADRAHADQANTVSASPDVGNGTTWYSSQNTNETWGAWYLSGSVTYSEATNPDSTHTFTFSPSQFCEVSLTSQGSGYIDATVWVNYIVYKYDRNTGTQTELSNLSGSSFQIPPGGYSQARLGGGSFTINPTTYGMRYKVKHSTSAAWTGDL
jgi:hypothetical protein